MDGSFRENKREVQPDRGRKTGILGKHGRKPWRIRHLQSFLSAQPRLSGPQNGPEVVSSNRLTPFGRIRRTRSQRNGLFICIYYFTSLLITPFIRFTERNTDCVWVNCNQKKDGNHNQSIDRNEKGRGSKKREEIVDRVTERVSPSRYVLVKTTFLSRELRSFRPSTPSRLSDREPDWTDSGGVRTSGTIN